MLRPVVLAQCSSNENFMTCAVANGGLVGLPPVISKGYGEYNADSTSNKTRCVPRPSEWRAVPSTRSYILQIVLIRACLCGCAACARTLL